MVEINTLKSPQLVEAVRLWTGWGESIKPIRNDKQVMARFGDEAAARLLPIIKSLADDFYASDARLVAANLDEMEVMASEHFKQRHPTVADEIVKAFAWCYTFDFK